MRPQIALVGNQLVHPTTRPPPGLVLRHIRHHPRPEPVGPHTSWPVSGAKT